MSLLKTKVNQLLLKFKNGNNYALKELFDLIYKKLKVLVWKYLKDKNSVDDVISMTFIQITNSIIHFDSNKDGYNWICKIAERKSLDLNRQTKTFDEFNDNIVDELDVFEKIDNKTDVDNEISKLTKEEQKLIHLYFYEGYTYKEIGKMYGYSAQMACKTVRKIIFKMQKNIKD